MAYEHIENLSSTPKSDIPGKGSGKRKKHPFRVKRKKDDVPQFLPTKAKYRKGGDTEVLHPVRKQALEDDPNLGRTATTSRNNDGMSFVW